VLATTDSRKTVSVPFPFQGFGPWMSRVIPGAAILAILAASALCGAAAEVEKKEGPPVPKLRKNNLAPLPEGEKVAVSHAPYEDGDCSMCHKNKDRKDPGPLAKPVNETCLECHDDFQKLLGGKSGHVAAKESCVNCHNPHNAKLPKLLVEDSTTLCLSCHQSISNAVSIATVKHDALTTDAKCANCHNPHGANIEHLLTALPGDLCLNCHGKDGLKDQDGKALTNMKKLLAENSEAHGPVADKDCSACHTPHGGDNFRLLTLDYPAQFYSPYDPKMYALCFDCHEDTLVQDAKTTTLTKFRNGDKNLHYLHVNKTDRGRTCRACHEVHAAKQKHQIRDAVPYGPKGWMLKVNFTQTPTGGSCAKTCHEMRGYTNSVAAVETKQASAEPAKPEPPKTP
jgi:predicted CXXCH cytochrome family protein